MEQPDLSRSTRLLSGVAAAIAQKTFSALAVLIALAAMNRSVERESFGILSLYVTFQVGVSIFDLGIGTSASREFARSMSYDAWLARFRVYETWALLLSMAILTLGGVACFALFPAISGSTHIAAAALAVVCLGFEIPTRLYIGVMLAQGRQAELAALVAVFDAMRWVGSVVACALTGTALAALVWQLVVIAIILTCLRRCAGGSRTGVGVRDLDWRLWLSVGRLVLLPLAIATLAGAGRLYADRSYAGAVLPLADVGVYTSTFTAVGVLSMLSTQLSSALVPRLSQHHAHNGWRGSLNLFGLASLVVGAVTTMGALVMLFRFRETMPRVLGFTGAGADLMYSILPLAVTASVLSALSGPAYSAVVAMGRFRTVAVSNIVGLSLCGLMLATGPTSLIGIAKIAVLSSATTYALIAAALWRRGSGSAVAVRLMVSQGFFIGWLVAAGVLLGSVW